MAEKPGALEVVFDRLNDECKLGDLCLLFHRTGKKEFSKLLEASRSKLIKRNKETAQIPLFYELSKTRQLLSHYQSLLHGKWKPIEKSVFEIYGELLKLQHHKIPSLKFHIKNLNQLTYIELQEIKELLEELSSFDRFFRGGQKSLWSESSSSSTTFSVRERARIIESLTNLGRGINLAKETGEELHKMLDLDSPKTQDNVKTLYSQVSHIAAAPTVVPSDWLRTFGPDIHSLRNSYEDLKEKDKQFESHYQTLQEKYNREFFSLNLSREVSQLHRYKSPLRILNPGYWKQHGKIFSYLKRDRRSPYLISALFGYKNLKSDMEVVERYQKLRNQFSSTQYEPRRAFQPFFNVEDRPNLQEIENALEWLEGLQKHRIWKGKDKIARVLSTTSHRQRLVKLQKDLQTAQVQIEDGFSFLKAHFPSAEEVVNHSRTSLQDATLDEISAFLEQAEQELDSFRDWIDYQHCIDRLKAVGLEQFLTSLQQSSTPPNLWYSVFEQGFYAEWLRRIEDKYRELRIFNANLHEQRVREFSERDVQQYDLARERLRQLHAERWQQWSEQPSSKQQLTLLKRESQSPKRAMGIRQFISEAADLVSVLKPCWLMSPIAVSECIDPEAIQFDTVIFDEASQIRTEYAISSIMRAKQVIVVGDGKQLPPTAFFSGISSDDDEDDGEQDFSYESFLATCESFMERKSLNWHYRSQDESLIEFSNKEFYHSELISFPNPVKDANRGVHFHFVEGAVYGRGETKPKNLREAEEVAKLALEHRRQGHQSLGIIAFSQAQADAIEDAIQKQLAQLSPEEPDVVEFFQEDSDKYFLKSLENVQGDERAVIILSFAYGKDKEGKFLHNFGPLTKLGGERRLNVAITRAKHKLVLVASVQPKELESDKENVSRLKRYFEYAQQNDRSLTWNGDAEDDRSIPLLVEDIYRTLQERGYEVRRSIGASEYPIDLGVIYPQRPGEFLLGIECDSLTYHKLATVRDRDRLRRQVLEKLNWRIHRVWAKEWFYNRDAEIDRLVRQIEQLQTQ